MSWKRRMLEEYGCETENVDVEARVYTESEIVPQLTKAFAACNPMTQFGVGPYRVDIYLQGPKIAVECDENGHSSYGKVAEASRESFIKETLGCRFVRFNPHAAGFDVLDVVAAIVRTMIT